MSSTTNESYPQTHPSIPYTSASNLNTLSLYLPRAPIPTDRRPFLIYIHGGAWRDPLISASSFATTQAHLLSHPGLEAKIAGIASLNYRLSPYPSHATEPSDPNDPARNAKHPEHINDVLCAILFLQEKYGFGSRYVLVAHSCGATLALQVAMKRFWGEQYDPSSALELNVEPPVAIVGVEGIYDLPALVDDNAEIAAYRELVVNAFGGERGVWEGVSPVRGEYGVGWEEGRVLVVVHSGADELVGMEQAEGLVGAFGGWVGEGSGGRRSDLIRLEGLRHDEVWEDGRELALVIRRVVEEVYEME